MGLILLFLKTFFVQISIDLKNTSGTELDFIKFIIDNSVKKMVWVRHFE